MYIFASIIIMKIFIMFRGKLEQTFGVRELCHFQEELYETLS